MTINKIYASTLLPVNQAFNFPCSDSLGDESQDDPGIYALMKTITGNMLICLTVVG